MKKKVIVIGAGGHGNVIADIVRKSGDDLLGFLDDDETKKTLVDAPLLGDIASCQNRSKDIYYIIGIGSAEIRRKIAERFAYLSWYTAVHPAAVIGENVEIGSGSAVMANAVINPGCRIGKHSIVNTGSVFEHGCCLGDFSHLAPGAVVGGDVVIGDFVHVGIGATLIHGCVIADRCLIGAGGVVVKNLPDSGVYVGVPVKKIKDI
ncbi:MAG: acetyltransferase [Lentisphaeria bacterium]|nr:acetyltransferase [Lentisphaeria bacterium]